MARKPSQQKAEQQGAMAAAQRINLLVDPQGHGEV